VDEERAIRQVTRVVQELRPQALLTWPPDGVSGHPDHVAVSHWTGEAFRRLGLSAVLSPQSLGLRTRGLSKDSQRRIETKVGPLALYHIVVPRSLAQALEMPHLHTVPDEAVTLTVDVSAVWEAKMAAIRCHRTQISGSPMLNAPEKKWRLFLGTEHFRLATLRPFDKLRVPPGSGQVTWPEVSFFERLEENNL
jgi:LmbE family N-acetylglucosaminyl deacetylase